MPDKQAAQSTWYTRISIEERRVLDATSNWLRQIPWQWFITLTFPWNVGAETAASKLKQWLNTLERQLRTQICYVAGMERKPETHGIEVPWHFHLLVTAQVALPQDLLSDTWEQLVWRRATRHSEQCEGVNAPALVDSYVHHLKGPEYCLKLMNDCNGDWQFRWLELFLPHQKQTSFPDGRAIRQRRRFLEQSKET